MIARLTASTWLRAAVSGAILAYLLARLDLRGTGAAILRITPLYAVVVVGLVALDRGVMIARWALLLRASRVPVSLKSAAWIFLTSSFIGSALPAGVGADAARAYTLARRTANGSEAVASVAIDRLLGVGSIAALGTLGALLWTRDRTPELRQLAVACAIFVAVSAASALWSDRLTRRLMPDRWLEARGLRWMLDLADAVGRYRGRARVMTAVFALSLIVQVLRTLQAYLLGASMGIDVDPMYYLVFMPIGLLMMLLPISVAGVGLPQGAIVWLLRPLGVPDAQAFALSTLLILLGLVGNLPGAWLCIRARRT